MQKEKKRMIKKLLFINIPKFAGLIWLYFTDWQIATALLFVVIGITIHINYIVKQVDEHTRNLFFK